MSRVLSTLIAAAITTAVFLFIAATITLVYYPSPKFWEYYWLGSMTLTGVMMVLAWRGE